MRPVVIGLAWIVLWTVVWPAGTWLVERYRDRQQRRALTAAYDRHVQALDDEDRRRGLL